MPTYITLLNFTDQGIRNIRELPQRLDAARQAVEAAGGTLQSFLTLGQYDAVGIVEAPSDEAAATLLLAIGSRGECAEHHVESVSTRRRHARSLQTCRRPSAQGRSN